MKIYNLLSGLVIFLLLSCGGSKDAGDTYQGKGFVERERMLVKDNVKDKDRMTQMLTIIDKEADMLNSFDDTRTEYSKKIIKQMDDYNSTPEELTATMIDFQNEFKELVLLMAIKNAELKAIATSKEWEDISKLKDFSIFK